MKKIIVIGSGILGASTAFHLAESGVDVTIIDRYDIGQATDAAAGIICPWISQRRNKAWYELVKNGARYYPELIEKLASHGIKDTGYRKVGAISLHTDPAKLEQMAERARKRSEDAPEIGKVSILSPTETRAIVPLVSDGYGSVYVSGGARVDGRAMRDALLHAAIKLGVIYKQGDAKLFYKNGQVCGICVDRFLYECDQVIVTSGAWGRELLEPLGVKFMVKGQKAQILHLGLLGNERTGEWPVVIPPNNQYLLSFEGGRVVVGATHEDDKGFDARVTAGGLHEILDKAMEIFPSLAEAEVIETRVGFRPFTPDFLPVIGPVPGVRGLLVANGLGASGLTSGPYLGAELARLAIGDKMELDIGRYSVEGAIE